MRTDILTTLQMRYRAEMLTANCNVRTYMESSTGIGEHSDIVEAIEVQIAAIAEAEDKLNVCNSHFGFGKNDVRV